MQCTYCKSSSVNEIDNCIEIYLKEVYLKEIHYRMLTLSSRIMSDLNFHIYLYRYKHLLIYIILIFHSFFKEKQ